VIQRQYCPKIERAVLYFYGTYRMEILLRSDLIPF
jgi:hypothetical protein